MKACSTCIYWMRKNELGRAGECRRFPPTTIGPIDKPPHPDMRPRPEHYFPVTLELHWCGEHRGRVEGNL